MTNKNMSDLIEEYFKQVLAEEGSVEIQRNKVADLFNCVPSQINYVINTRFTMQHGYVVESKRGGGGYIRIVEIQLNKNKDQLEEIKEIVGEHLSQKDAEIIIKTLFENELMTQREASIMLAAVDDKNFSGNRLIDYQLRANILLSMIEFLIIKNK